MHNICFHISALYCLPPPVNHGKVVPFGTNNPYVKHGQTGLLDCDPRYKVYNMTQTDTSKTYTCDRTGPDANGVFTDLPADGCVGEFQFHSHYGSCTEKHYLVSFSFFK